MKQCESLRDILVGEFKFIEYESKLGTIVAPEVERKLKVKFYPSIRDALKRGLTHAAAKLLRQRWNGYQDRMYHLGHMDKYVGREPENTLLIQACEEHKNDKVQESNSGL